MAKAFKGTIWHSVKKTDLFSCLELDEEINTTLMSSPLKLETTVSSLA